MTPRLRLVWFGLIVLASALYFLLLASAALDLGWALPRVMNGQYESLPWTLRLAFLGAAALMIAQVVFARRLLEHGGAWSGPSAVASMLLVLLYVLSTVLSAISPSGDSRWNAIPAFALMLSFFMLRAPEERPTS